MILRFPPKPQIFVRHQTKSEAANAKPQRNVDARKRLVTREQH